MTTELAMRFSGPTDPGVVARRARLRTLLASLPPALARPLLSRLRRRDPHDALSMAFHDRLATPTRTELLGILASKTVPAPRATNAPTIAVSAPTTTAPYHPPSRIADWRDLVRFRVAPGIIDAFRSPLGDTYSIQRIEAAKSDDVNLDYYPVYVAVMPVILGVRLEARQLLAVVRQRINLFVDTRISSFEPASDRDASRWRSVDPRGAVIYIDIEGPDNAYVVCSDISPTFWRFSTLTKLYPAVFGPNRPLDEHPVSGTREFGFSGTPQRAVFYTKGADRGSWPVEWINRQAFSGGHRLWLSFQRGLVDFVNRNGGRAQTFMVGERGEPFISARHNWRSVDRLLG
jgi:hypothetical protein